MIHTLICSIILAIISTLITHNSISFKCNNPLDLLATLNMCILSLSVDGKEMQNLIDNFSARHLKQYLYYLYCLYANIIDFKCLFVLFSS